MTKLKKDLSNWAEYAEALRKEYKANKGNKMKDFINSLQKYNKLWVALIGSIVNLLVVYFAGEEWVNVLVSILTIVGVYTAPNKEKL